MSTTGPARAGLPLVIQTEQLDDAAAAWLAERCQLIRCASEDARFPELLASASGLLIRTYTRVDSGMLARAPHLKAVARAGVGLDNVDVDACRARGIAVFNTPDANTQAVVEYITALMLDDLRPRCRLDNALPIAEWKSRREHLVARDQLSDLTLGILGLGKIGRRIAGVAGSLGMRALYHDLIEIPRDARSGAEPVDLKALLASADVLTLHVDGRASNRGVFGATEFAHLRPRVLLINSSRGFVVDPAAAASFFRENPQARGVFDVHEPEPFDSTYPLLGLPNVRLLPHIAAATRTAHRNMSWVVRDLWDALSPR